MRTELSTISRLAEIDELLVDLSMILPHFSERNKITAKHILEGLKDEIDCLITRIDKE